MSESETIQSELRELLETVTKTLASHKTALIRHEEVLAAEFKAGKSHSEAIQILRTDMLGLGDLVNQQSRLLTSMQSVLLKVVANLGMTDESPMPPPSEPN